MLGKQETGTDDVSLRKLAFSGSNADVLLGDGTWGTVNPTGADDQNLTGATLTGNLLTIDIENGNSATVDLSNLVGTDDQNLTGATLTGTILTIDIENGASVNVDLSSLVSPAIGNYCSDVDNPLTDDFEIPMNGRSYNFVAPGGGRINIGQVSCGLNADARVYIRNNNHFTSAIRAESIQTGGIGGKFVGTHYGISAEGSTYAGYFNGNVFTTGSYQPSDQNLKNNVVDYDSSLYVISMLEPKSFEYDNAYAPQMNLSDGHQYGLIAQEVENILPSIVTQVSVPAKFDSTGTLIHPSKTIKGVDYEQLIPILIGGMQEQQGQISSQDSIINTQDSLINNLNNRLTSLENCLSGILPYLCELSNTAIQQNDENTQDVIVKELKIILEDNASIMLEQNVPNPFAEQTVIEYFVPEAVQKAQIHFYDIRGQLIKSVEIEEMGKGQLTVFASDLSTGTYTYTLVADGQIISTKKMVKTN